MSEFSSDVAAASKQIDTREHEARALGKRIVAYARPSLKRSLFEIAITVIPFAILWFLIWQGLHAGFLPVILLYIPAAGFLLRLFIIQHDCGHGAMFVRQKTNNFVGHILGVFTLTPYSVWQNSHARHHATSGNLDKRGVGDIDTLTVSEYRQLSPMRRWFYRFYRHPLVMFGIGPTYLFLFRHRLPIGQMDGGWRPWISAIATNLVLVGLVFLLSTVSGLALVLAVHLPLVILAASAGVWLFYIQHQFEDVHWARNEEWTYHKAAMHGSSFYVLPPVLAWFTGNIGYHHIHHMVSRIPFYRLPQVMADNPQVADVNRITVKESFKSVRLALWDEQREALISFRHERSLA